MEGGEGNGDASKMRRLLATIFIVFSLGCAKEEKVREGFQLLSEGRYGEARDCFYKFSVNGNKDASIGLMLSDFLRIVEIIDYIYTLIGGHPTDRPFSPFEGDENIFLYKTLMNYLTSATEILEEGLYAGMKIDDYSGEIPYIPVHIGRKEVFNLGGRWDENDVKFFRGVISIISSLFHLILSQNLYADYYTIFEYAKPLLFEGGIDPGDPLKPVSAKLIINLIVFVLSSSPEFLEVNDETEWGLFGKRFEEGIQDIYDSLESGGKKFSVVKGETEWKFVIRNFVLTDEGNEDLERDFDRDALNSIGTLLDNLKGNIPYISWEEFSILLSFGVSLISGEQYYVLKSILPLLFSGKVAVDFGGFISTPFGLRHLLPLFRVDDTPEDNFFLLEWECPDEIPEGEDVGTLKYFPAGVRTVPYINYLLCSGGSPFSDMPHFTDAIYKYWNISPIEPDGISSPLPYISFSDPSFNGFFLINPSSIGYDISYPSGFTTPDLRLFNFFIQKEISPLLSLLIP